MTKPTAWNMPTMTTSGAKAWTTSATRDDEPRLAVAHTKSARAAKTARNLAGCGCEAAVTTENAASVHSSRRSTGQRRLPAAATGSSLRVPLFTPEALYLTGGLRDRSVSKSSASRAVLEALAQLALRVRQVREHPLRRCVRVMVVD